MVSYFIKLIVVLSFISGGFFSHSFGMNVAQDVEEYRVFFEIIKVCDELCPSADCFREKTEEERVVLRNHVFKTIQNLVDTYKITQKRFDELIPLLAQDLACDQEYIKSMVHPYQCEEDSI